MIKYIRIIRVEWEYFKICWGKTINVGVGKKISPMLLALEEKYRREFHQLILSHIK
jgi:hypothetical protein